MFTTIRLPLAGLVLAVVLGACSGAAAGPSVASLDDPGASSSPAASAAPTDPREAFLAYAQCMRDEGIDMPDPEVVDTGGESGGKGSVAFRVGGPGPDSGVDKDEYAAADATCRHHLANVLSDRTGGGLSPEDEEKLLAFTRCMREHGIDLPDPGTGGVIIDEGSGSGPKFDPNDEEFQAAQEACGDLLPGKMQVNGSGPGSAPIEGGPSVKSEQDQ